ncbi:MAG: hypothetical protein L6R38_000191 [Xanthoria sp. 2 TBL-2021]|nr:MAG: hypothetical protein L6R38_000191 [Xanthoria sp. 2 TBL-2021]
MAQEHDDYSDDDLDALPDGTFQELQDNALESTQQAAREKPPTLPPLARPQKKTPAVLAQGLERFSVRGALPSFTSQRASDFPQLPSSDYGDLDDEMLDGQIYDTAEEPGANAIQASRAASLPVGGESTQREQWRTQRYRELPKHIQSNVSQAPGLAQMRNESQGNHMKLGDVQETTSDDDTDRPSRRPDIDALNAQILELRSERDQLEKARQAAEEAALAKSGEIAIIRANQSKSEKIYESKIQELQKLHLEEAARQRLEVERALAEKQKITTEKGFLQNDLAEGNAQIRSLQRAVKARANTTKATTGKDSENAGPPTTPKKNKSLGHGDGFEDDELQLTSPSKLPYRSKTSTPKAGNKRKRKAVPASPIKPLQLSQANDRSGIVDLPDEAPVQPTSNTTTAHSPAITAPATAPPDRRFELSQQVMNHHMNIDGKRTFEALSDFSYPSKTNTTLSTIFLDKMAALSVRNDVEHFPVALSLVIISMWKQCVDEKFWNPIHLLLDLTRFTVFISPINTGPLLVDALLEVIQSTADVNVIPRVRRQPQKFSSEVSTFDCLELLKSVADDCVAHEEDIIRFWRCMRFDFIAMILNVVQPIQELHVVIGLLRTSVQKDTFAMIVPPNDGKQEPSETNLIDLLTRLLVEKLKPPKDEEPYSVVDIADLRLSVLSLMGEMCDNRHSSQALASSQHAVGRLVWVMNDELDALYDYKYGHEYSAELVNEATRLLFRLRTDHPQSINMHEKLKVIPNSGGVHKHLIALTRLALSEGVFFEEEIEDDVVECAYEMLEDLSSPEEAEALREAFSTARSR